MITAGEEARERARRLRRVLVECEAILADPTADPERQEAARRWHNLLGGVGSLADGAYSMMVNAGTYGGQRHTRGGGQSDHLDADYDGWGAP